MTQSDTNDEIPEQIRDLLRDGEVENIRNRDGWAIGTATLVEDGEVGAETIDNACIELFNGDGLSGVFGGVRFMGVDDEGEYEESYAYATREAFEQTGKDNGWFIESYADPEDPDYGEPAP